MNFRVRGFCQRQLSLVTRGFVPGALVTCHWGEAYASCHLSRAYFYNTPRAQRGADPGLSLWKTLDKTIVCTSYEVF